MDDTLFADGIDGVHGLRRRQRTRLWYRVIPVADPAEEWTASDALLEKWAAEFDREPNRQTADLSHAARQERILRRLGDIGVLEETAPAAEERRPEERLAITGWRNAPINAPTLMLSASPLLDWQTPGPIFGPGCRYRVLTAEDGIVELQVMAADGHTTSGFCNAVDMSCIEPMIINLAGGRKFSTKQRLGKIGRGLSQMTGTLMIFSS